MVDMKKKIVNLCTKVSLDEILESIIVSQFDTKTLVNFASNLGEGGDVEFDIELLKKTIDVIISCEDKDDEHLTKLIEKLKEVKRIL